MLADMFLGLEFIVLLYTLQGFNKKNLSESLIFLLKRDPISASFLEKDDEGR